MGSEETWLAQARAGIEALAGDPADPVGRGLLGEAWARLDAGTRPDWVVQAREALLVPALPDWPLRTERLVLRLPTATDLDGVLAMWGDPEVTRYLPVGPLDEAGVRARIAQHGSPRADDDVLHLVLVVEESGTVVGEMTVRVEGPSFSTAEVGWVLRPGWTGRGVASEAARECLRLLFEVYRVHRVHASLDPRNDASAALCERLGMQRESLTRRDYWGKGEWSDSLGYGILREEWEARTPGSELPRK